jgi:hypothetical protein
MANEIVKVRIFDPLNPENLIRRRAYCPACDCLVGSGASYEEVTEKWAAHALTPEHRVALDFFRSHPPRDGG